MPCAKVLYCVIRQAYGMSCVEVASTVSVGDPPSVLSRSKHGPPVGVSLLAIGCEAVVKKAGFTTAGKPFRLYREQGGAPPRSLRKKHFHSDSYFLFDESWRRLRMLVCHGYCLRSLQQFLEGSSFRECFRPGLFRNYFFWTKANQRSSAFTPSADAHHLADSKAWREMFCGAEGSFAARSAGMVPVLNASGLSGP